MKRKEVSGGKEINPRPKKRSKTEKVQQLLASYDGKRYNLGITNNYLFAPTFAYVPQMKDGVFFFKKGYLTYLKGIGEDPIDNLLLSDNIHHENFTNFDELEDKERCEVKRLDYELVEPVKGISVTFFRITLTISRLGKDFTINYVESPSCICLHFLVLESLERATAKFLSVSKVGDIVSVYLPSYDASYRAKILKVGKSVDYASVKVGWIYGESSEVKINDYDESETKWINPWEIHEVDRNGIVGMFQRRKSKFNEEKREEVIEKLKPFCSRNQMFLVDYSKAFVYPITLLTISQRVQNRLYRHYKQLIRDLDHVSGLVEQSFDRDDKEKRLRLKIRNIIQKIRSILKPDMDDSDFDLDEALLNIKKKPRKKRYAN